MAQSVQHINKRILFTEISPKDIPIEISEAITKYGEGGEAQWLARAESVSMECPEPDLEFQKKTLCGNFEPQDVAYTFIVRNLNAWFKRTTQSTFASALSQTVSRELKLETVYGFAPTLEWFYEHHQKLFGAQAIEDAGFLASISDPRYPENSVTNKIIATTTQIRNEYILNKIKEAWTFGQDIFVVYGRGHLDSLRINLEKLN